ncbi:hypothetical protein ACJMK2_017108 [Sinanodonta woodiana]|uniref:Polysaccharide lyase 14 domain-containing protein n=1 Tax=Sinanodonta woodiana TaxID=1069815 RepID=A0ABD3UVV5_SINWO
MLFVVLSTCILELGRAAELWSWNHETHKANINDLMKQKFEYTDHSGQFGISEEDSLSVQEDPVNHGQYVLSVFYRQGTFTHHDHNGNNCPHICHRGAQFYVNPKKVRDAGHQITDMTLEYEVYFNHSFGWQKGGKLPGLWGGDRDCSGGRISDHCFSTRLMWRSGGQGEVYAYVTHDQKAGTDFNSWCDSLKSREIYHKVGCSDHDGIGIGTGAFHFQTGKWIKLSQRVQLNSHPHQHGSVTLWVNDHAEIHMNDIVMRNQFNFGIDGLFFSTFYGGNDPSWKCPADTTTLFRNFRLSTDAPQLVQSQLVG